MTRPRIAPRIAVAPNRRPNDYLESVRLSGGEPWLLDPARDSATAILDGAAGILLTGGGDVDPRYYGEAPHPAFYRAEPGRDELELELAIRAIERDIPLFCICRAVDRIKLLSYGRFIVASKQVLDGSAI